MGLLDEAIREHLELKRLRGADPAEVARMEREALGPVRRAEPGAEGSVAADGGEVGFDADGLVEPVGPANGTGGVHPSGPVEDVPAAYAEPPAGVVPAGFPEDSEVHDPVGADDRSMAPASYGQETAEYDVEALVGDEPAAPAQPPPVSPAGATPDAPAPPRYEEGLHTGDAPEADPGTYPPPHGDELSPSVAAPDDDATQVHPAHPAEQHEPDEPRERESPRPDALDAEVGEDQEAEDVLEETPEFLQETPEHERLWFEQRPPRDFDFDK